MALNILKRARDLIKRCNREVMSAVSVIRKDIQSCVTRTDETVVEALERIDRNRGRTLFVVDYEGKLKGSLSDGDVRRWIISSGRVDGVVGEAMHTEVTWIHIREKENAEQIMNQKAIEGIPILDDAHNIVEVVYKRLESLDSKSSCELSGYPIVIMAGGKGKRLNPYTLVLPKPLIPIKGKTIIERIISRFLLYGVEKFYLTVNYRKEMIKSYFSEIDHQYELEYIDEDKPMGTAGGLRMLAGRFSSPIIVTNCDILIDYVML